MPPFIVCIHDASPAHLGETRTMIRELAPLVGRGLSIGVVPDWHGRWPLAGHPAYCRQLVEASEELLLHGYFHRRQRGCGPVTVLTGGSDEMNGLNDEQTRSTIARGQQMFADAFGQPARGFLAPAWQVGRVRVEDTGSLGLQHVLGFFSLASSSGARIPLATWTWDSSRWGWTGHIGHGLGSILRRRGHRVPVLAIHPRDIGHGFWPAILRLLRRLLEAGYQPTTAARLLEARAC